MAEIQLEAVVFNHDISSHHRDALNIRWNAAAALLVPEWQRGVSLRPTDAVAAYAIDASEGQTISIRARFSTSNPLLRRAQVRAIIGPAAGPDGHGSVLGAVAAIEVTFDSNQQTGLELLAVEDQHIGRYGIGVHYLGWWWQYRRSGTEPWTTFGVSEHTIFTVLSAPTAPWEQDGYPLNSQLPWVEALDVACRWARGATTAERAATRVTEAVYDLGPELLEYNCPNLGAPMYVSLDALPLSGVFHCTAFLDLLHGGVGRGRYVNCSDCAAIVSTFANLLGCDLYQSRMGVPAQGFLTNPILAIGVPAWGQPCGWWPGFGMHEVAWGGECTAADVVFDACLAVDADHDPARPPHTPLLPTNIPFGSPGQGFYRDQLATAAAREECEAQPGTRQRRRLI